MSLRTLKFGDRTFSYDTGLDLVEQEQQQKDMENDVVPSSTPGIDSIDQADDGIGSSDDETTGSKSSMALSEDEKNQKTSFESDNSPNNQRKIIRPDPSTINQLLAFDEEEEDDYEEEDEEEAEKKPSQSGWHKTIVKDLANLSPTSSVSSTPPKLQRRHSITICESKQKIRRKSSSASSSSSDSSTGTPSNRSPRHSRCQQDRYEPHSLAPSFALNVGEMHAALQDEFESSMTKKEALTTLNLRLDEVAHIRSVLTKAELEGLPIDGNVRAEVEKGKVCFLCMKTRFGIFSRGQKCEMCKQIVCHRCHSKMRIPLEHFNNTPVFALSPSSNHDEQTTNNYNNNEQLQTHNIKEKKQSLPDSLGLLLNKSVGSAPNSPTLDKKSFDLSCSSDLPVMSSMLPTISAGFQPQHHNNNHATLSKYATLPKKNRRMSWGMSTSREMEREKLEGSMLTVCTDCKDMVLQVIRTSRTTRRMQMVRSMFLTMSPGQQAEHRL